MGSGAQHFLPHRFGHRIVRHPPLRAGDHPPAAQSFHGHGVAAGNSALAVAGHRRLLHPRHQRAAVAPHGAAQRHAFAFSRHPRAHDAFRTAGRHLAATAAVAAGHRQSGSKSGISERRSGQRGAVRHRSRRLYRHAGRRDRRRRQRDRSALLYFRRRFAGTQGDHRLPPSRPARRHRAAAPRFRGLANSCAVL